MSDEVDDLLRRAMATLDHQAPSGYFDTLADRTLARLDGPALAEPPPDEEDSGLKDIRTLAIETRARLSSRRSSQDIPAAGFRDRPASSDLSGAAGDALASSSSSWTAVALPEPPRPAALSAALSGGPPPSRDGVAADPAIGAPGPRTRTRRTPILAAIGVGLAAAAGVVTFVSLRARDASAPTLAQRELVQRLEQSSEESRARQLDRVAPATKSSPAAPSMTQIEPRAGTAIAPGHAEQGADAGAVGTASRGAASGSGPPSRADPLTRQLGRIEIDNGPSIRAYKERPATKGDDKPSARPPSKLMPPEPGPIEPRPAPPAEPAAPAVHDGKAETVTAHGSGAGEPSFDELLKEAGVDEHKPGKPKLDRTQLSSDDIKRGMNAVAAQAGACFDGTRGLATVRLSVAPSGKIQKVTVSGPFAGTAVGTCVERAVRSATFPPWDGAPQSFGYSYLLSE